MARKKQTHCIKGHEFCEENTYWSKGKRQCKACAKLKPKRKDTRKNRKPRKNDMTATRACWSAAKSRCYNKNVKNYPDYGGRGISMWEPWKQDFNLFYLFMGVKPENMTLDRINNDGNYEPGNVRWATQKEQCNNHRRNVKLSIFGRTQTITEWAEEYGMKPDTLLARIKKQKMEPQEALTKKVGKPRGKTCNNRNSC